MKAEHNGTKYLKCCGEKKLVDSEFNIQQKYPSQKQVKLRYFWINENENSLLADIHYKKC